MRLVTVAITAIGIVLGTACAPPPSPTATAPPPKPAATTPPAKPTEAPAAKPTAAPKSAFDERAVADFYRGKTVRIIVGFAAGGGFDTYSRTIARHLSRYIPGNPTVIVENLPGAGTIVAANQVYNSLPKDGTVIGNIGGPIILEQLFKTDGVQFDLARFNYVAVPVAETYIMVLTRRAGVSSLQEIMGPSGKQVVVGGIPGSTVEHAPVLLRDVLGANIKVVSGYEGTSKVRLAMDNGEVDGFFNTWQSIKVTNSEEVKSGQWLVLAQMSAKPLPDLPQKNVPTLADIARTDEERQLLLYGTSYPNQFGKVYVMAPEVPPDRVAAMETAFMKTMADREFLADAEKGKLEVGPVPGSEVKKLVQEMLGMSENIRSKLEKLLKRA